MCWMAGLIETIFTTVRRHRNADALANSKALDIALTSVSSSRVVCPIPGTQRADHTEWPTAVGDELSTFVESGRYAQPFASPDAPLTS
jgi:hypothetical protein